jgi:hypothetical protein
MLLVPTPLRAKLGDSASEGLMTMFADAHRLATESFERRILEVSTSFEHRLAEEIGKLRVDLVQQLAAMRFDLLKWSFLFWIGQLAGILAVLSLVLDSR